MALAYAIATVLLLIAMVGITETVFPGITEKVTRAVIAGVLYVAARLSGMND